MNHKTKKLPDSKIEFEITVSVEEMEKFWQVARKKVAGGVKIDGFRPGKAPSHLSSFIEEDVHNEAANLAMNETFKEVIKKEDVEIIGIPNAKIIKIAPKNEFVYKIETAYLQDIELPDYKSIAKEVLKDKKDQKIEDEEIQK